MLRACLAVLLIVGVAVGAAETAREAAHRVLRCVRENSTVPADLAGAADPDPWLVSDELCLSGEYDAAQAFARAVPRPDVEALPRYVEGRRKSKPDPRVRPALEAAGGDRVAAIPLLEKVRGAGDAFERARVASELGSAYADSGRDAESTRAFAEAADLALEVGWLAGAVDPLVYAGQGALRDYDYDGAERWWTRLRQLQEKRGEAAFAATTILNLGALRGQAGDFQGALERFTEAVGRLRALGETAMVPGALANIGLVHARQGEFRKACLVYQEAIELAAPGERARLLQLLADAQISFGDNDAAKRAYDEALAELQGSDDGLAVAQVQHDMGVLALSTDPARALDLLTRSRRVFEKSGTPLELARCVGNMGAAQTKLGRHAEAIALHREALEAARPLGDPWLVGEIVNELGNAQVAAGAFEAAFEPYAEGLEIGERIGSSRLVVDAELGRTRAELGRKRYAPAAEAARRGIDALARSLRGLADRQGALARARNAELYRVAAVAAVGMGDPSVLFGFLESGRAGTLLESLEDADAVRSVAIPPKLREQEEAARLAESRASALYERALREGNLKESKARREAWRAAIAATEQVVERIQAQAKDAADFLYPRRASLDDVRAGLPEGDALVLYACLDERVVALVVTRAAARIVTLDAAAVRVTAERGAVDGAALRGILATPLGLDASIRRVLVSPDGPLFFVPFCVCFEGRDVVYVPSATTQHLLASRAPARGAGVLAIGNPDYTGRDLLPLPGAAREARSVGDEVLLGAEATEARLRKSLAGRKRWRALHLACHGLIDPDQPLRSALALTTTAPDDGRLTALEVLSMQIPADLAVLSACETARGRIYSGEGMVGLTRAFLFAGVPRVVVSLWKTDDASTEALMRKFYDLWNPKDGSKGLSAATALRKAQEFVASQEQWKDPKFWAAWQLWGLPE